MESTGTYWQPLFNTLQDAGFEVLLVNGIQTKTIRGKTDVKDSRRIQLLHSLGLLNGSFLPESAVLALRTITRHRSSLTEAYAKYMLKVQKCLRLMSIRLDVAIRDVAGKTGSAIVTAILNGERDAQTLGALADPRVKKFQAELVDLLQGQWDDTLLYELRDCWELMDVFNHRIEAFKHGRGAAITATARKLAVILWNMVVHKMPYQTLESKAYQDILKMRKMQQLKIDIKK